MLLFHLFTFVPVLLLAGILWIERVMRKGPKKKNTFLFLSIFTIFIAGVVQALASQYIPNLVHHSSEIPIGAYLNFPVYGVIIALYFVAFFLLEYSIHCKRIDESFLTLDFRKSLGSFTGLTVVYLLILGVITWVWVELFLLGTGELPTGVTKALFESFLGPSARGSARELFNQVIPVLTLFFHVIWILLVWKAARSAFDLQAGVIRMRSYTFYTLLLLTLFFAYLFSPFSFLHGPAGDAGLTQSAVSIPNFYENYLWLFMIPNIIFTVRVVEEFFFWAMYHLRSDRAKVEQRQHTLSLLIRKVIKSTEEEDIAIVRETMENALTKAKSRTVVEEYNVTGMVVYRRTGNILKVEDQELIWGYANPLVSTKNFKNLDKAKLNELILRTTYDVEDIEQTSSDSSKDFGANLIKQMMEEGQAVVLNEMPDNFKGLQRMIGLFPVYDTNKFAGMLVVFKDSFHQIYPFEKEVFKDLCENLGTIFALMAGKEVQKERNRLQGEMQTAKNIQTSILPGTMEIPGYSIASSMETATEVGGDVYDLVSSPFGNYLGIGDVSGHGLPAGIMALINMSAFHGALETSKTMNVEVPIDVLYDIVNRVLCVINRDRIGSDKFMTQNYFVEKNGTFEHSGTHEIALIYRKAKNEIEELHDLTDKTGFLGLSEMVDSSQSRGSFKMDSGDILLLYTDGVIEAKTKNEIQFGLERVKELMMDYVEATPGELIVQIKDHLRDFAKAGDMKKHHGHFADDITMVVIKKD